MSHLDESFPSEQSNPPVYYSGSYDYPYYPPQEPFPLMTYPSYIDPSLPPVFNDNTASYTQTPLLPEASETIISSTPSQGTPYEASEDLTSPYNSELTLPTSEPNHAGPSFSNDNYAMHHDVRLKCNIDATSLDKYLLLISSRPKLYRCMVCYTSPEVLKGTQFAKVDMYSGCMGSEVLKGTQAAKAHVYRHLFGVSKPYSCRTCNVEFASERAAERHRRYQDKKFPCQFCGRPFARKDARRSHENKGKCARSLAGFPTETHQ